MKFYGVNAVFLEQYVAFKRNMGYAFKDIYTFKMFDHFNIENNTTTIGLTKELAQKWIEKRPNESDGTRYRRVNEIINFSIYLNHLGYDSYIPKQVNSFKTSFTPYIFSKEELKSFFTACDTIEVHKKSTMRYILPIVFRMIYACGLRSNESLSLKCEDVNLNEGYIIIRNPKNSCDRMLPLSDSLINVCVLYRKRCLSVHNADDYFFRQKNGKRYTTDTLYKWFRRILWQADISHGGKGKWPRVHDLSYPNLNIIQTFCNNN